MVTRPAQPSVFLIQVATQELADAMLQVLKDYMSDDPVLKAYDHLPRCFPIPVPLYAPLTDQQAKLWSERHWPCVYNPAAQVLQDAPPLHQLRKVMTEQDTMFTDECLALAELVGKQAFESGKGKAIGAVVVDPVTKQVIAVAGDARWHDQEDDKQNCPNGRPEYHALMRVISMVANKELRRRLAAGRHVKFADTCAEGIPGQPLYPAEDHYLQPPQEETVLSMSEFYDALPPLQTEVRGEGYLCSGLDIYLTHEPCVCCGMAMVHSRFRTCIFINRVLKSGALTARIDKNALGYGLFWRRELNWRVMTFHYKNPDADAKPAVSSEVFQA